MLNENWYRDVQGHDGDASDDLGALDNRQASLTESNKITTTSSSTMSSTSISENTVETTTSSSIMSSTSISVNTAESTTDVVQSTNSPEGSVSTQPSSSKHDGVSGGAVAGAAVGCLVVGILVGFLAAFLLFKRRMKGSPATKLKRQSSEFTTLASKTEIYSNDRQIDISQFLLDGSSDEDIASELHSLSDLIYQHVENHYHLRPVRIDSYTLAQKFAQIGLTKASGWGPDAIAALCIDIKSRHAGLRHVISQILFQNIDINIPGPLSLLPPSISAFLQTRPVINSSYRKSPAYSTAISQWRKLSALLLHPNPDERTHLSPSNTISQQASSIAGTLMETLKIFISSDQELYVLEHLQAVAVECAKFGYVLFSHPADWTTIYVEEAHSGRSLVVCPGLDKISDVSGDKRSPVRVVDPVTIQL